EILAIKDFVNNGGILLLAGLGWSWITYHPDKTLEDLPANKIGKEFGIKWVDGVIKETGSFIYNDSTVFTILYPESLFGIERRPLYKAQCVGSKDGLYGGSVYSIAIDPKNTSTIYAGTGYGIFKYSNDGMRWTQIGLKIYKVWSISINPQNTQIIYAGTNGGIFKSVDGGENWVKILNAEHSEVIIDPIDTQTVFASVFGSVFAYKEYGMFKSTDGGTTWKKIRDHPFTSIAIDPSNTQIIYIGSESSVFKSTDGGLNWVKIDNGLPKVSPSEFLYYESLAIDPTNTQIIYAGTDVSGADHGIFKSTNGGKSWTKINNGLKNNPYGDMALRVYDIAIDPTNTKVIYAGTETAVFGESIHDDGIY
ncbi:MAG: VPS10 domain-containing protein, partial [Fervidicoccus fontis]